MPFRPCTQSIMRLRCSPPRSTGTMTTIADDAAYLGIWMGTETDHDLLRLNIEHSKRVADIFQDAVRRVAPELSTADMQARTYLFSHLLGRSIRLAVVSEDALARRILDEWKRVIRTAFLSPVAA